MCRDGNTSIRRKRLQAVIINVCQTNGKSNGCIVLEIIVLLFLQSPVKHNKGSEIFQFTSIDENLFTDRVECCLCFSWKGVAGEAKQNKYIFYLPSLHEKFHSLNLSSIILLTMGEENIFHLSNNE